MINEKNFFELQNRYGTYYTVGFELGHFESSCLCMMRAAKLGVDIKDITCCFDFSDQELEIVKRFYEGIVSILLGETLLRKYVRSVLDFGSEHRFAHERSFGEDELTRISEEQSIDILEYIFNQFAEELIEKSKEENHV